MVQDITAVCIDEVAPALANAGANFYLPRQPDPRLGLRTPQVEIGPRVLVAEQLAHHGAQRLDALVLRQIGQRALYGFPAGDRRLDVCDIVRGRGVATVQSVESGMVQVAHQLGAPDGDAQIVVFEAHVLVSAGIDPRLCGNQFTVGGAQAEEAGIGLNKVE